MLQALGRLPAQAAIERLHAVRPKTFHRMTTRVSSLLLPTNLLSSRDALTDLTTCRLSHGAE
jgi:hypothetical protein